MLHATAAGASSDVQDKCVVIKRRTFHQLNFILANPLQLFFDLLLSPFFAVDHNGHVRRNARQVEFLKLPDFDGAVSEGVIAGALNNNRARAAEEVPDDGCG